MIVNEFERQYLNIMEDVIINGIDRPDRTGIGSRAIWHQSMRINLQKGFPIITTRKVALRIAFEETWFFLRGETDTKKLEEKKINIWKGNTTREFLDNRNLDYLPEGHMGKGYSFQWRNFDGDYIDRNTNPQSDETGTDQVIYLLKGLKHDPNGRRHIITAWNPNQVHEAALPPCHLYQQYQILDGKLNSSFVARSQDFLYGTPYNVMGYALLNEVFSKYLKLTPGILGYLGEDVHLYANQIDMAKEQTLRIPSKLPTIRINKNIKTIDDILNLEYSDIELNNYNAQPDFENKPAMAI